MGSKLDWARKVIIYVHSSTVPKSTNVACGATEILGWNRIWSVARRWGSYSSQEQKHWNNKMLLMPEPPHRSCQGVNMPRKNVLSFTLANGQSSICVCECVDMFPICGIVFLYVCRRVWVGFRVRQQETWGQRAQVKEVVWCWRRTTADNSNQYSQYTYIVTTVTTLQYE